MKAHLARWILIALVMGVGLATALGPGRTPPASASRTLTIAAGSGHTCALLSDGSARCWGNNDHGQLGDGTTADSHTPVAVSGLSNAVAIAAGDAHTCALLSDGTARCWGYNADGQLGDGTTDDRHTPVAVQGLLSNAVAITAGTAHTCALLSDGTARCWGRNGVGQLGDGTTTDRLTPVTVSGLTDAVAIAAGGYHTCAVLSDGTAQCWGMNDFGQLGDGTTTWHYTPVAVSGLSNAVAIAAGSSHTCALLGDGTARCWGMNDFGQLGDGTTTSSSTPVAVSGLNNAVAIAAGGYHTCALLSDGTAKCWGNNWYGQLGDNTTTQRLTPVAVSGLSNAVAIAGGYLHTCALLSDGTAKCWGDNGSGQLGDGTTTDSNVPVAVSGLAYALTPAISAGGLHTCALLGDGSARCWGHNMSGQLGDGTNTGPEMCGGLYLCSSTPVAVSGLANAVAIAAGLSHTCALLGDGTARCWGYNVFGQLGDGTTTSSSTPVAVSGLTNAVAIAAGGYHTCALLSDGTARCWGYNGTGQLGDGTTTGSSTPVAVSGLSNGVAIAAGASYTCALLSDGSARCWGYNFYGQLGDGTTAESLTPVAVSGLSSAIAVAAGDYHTCALLGDGTARCWGYNEYGQVGDGTNTGPEMCGGLYPCSTTPVAVSGLSSAIAIAAGDYHTCAVLSDGTARCWGYNYHGQLGDGTRAGPEMCGSHPCSTTPVAVSGLSSAVAIAAGDLHTCAVLSDGTARCWGSNGYGQLGNGAVTEPETTPVAVLLDTDSDGVPDTSDNCRFVANPGQENADYQIGNGTGIPGDDATVPNSAGDDVGDACDSPDADNDGLPNASDSDPGGDITYDDNNNGNPCVPLGTDGADDGPSWDSNCNGIRDGMEGSCPLAVNPNGDDDGDGLLNTWEVCKWGTDPTKVDSDGDTLGDCVEAVDTNGNGIILGDFGADALNSARATLLPAGTGPGQFGKDGDFDLNGNNVIAGDFGADTLTVAKMTLGILPCK
jgi:alpha-tubulin suppressor-like RCC1 family protein